MEYGALDDSASKQAYDRAVGAEMAWRASCTRLCRLARHESWRACPSDASLTRRL